MRHLTLALCLSCLWAVPLDALTLNQRIVNGQPAETGQFPFTVAVYSVHSVTEDVSVCGGTLVTQSWVLTSAHCLLSSVHSTSYVIVIFGTKNVQELDNAVVRQTSNIYTHSEYNQTTLAFNIAFILLPEAVPLTENIKPVDYLSSRRYDSRIVTTAIGWGMTSETDSPSPDLLYHVDVETISNDECIAYYGSYVTNHTLCTMGPTTEGICQGDPGGPLIQITSNQKFILVGIASFYSAKGCEASEPSGFVRISDFFDFIKAVTHFVQDEGDEDEDQSQENVTDSPEDNDETNNEDDEDIPDNNDEDKDATDAPEENDETDNDNNEVEDDVPDDNGDYDPDADKDATDAPEENDGTDNEDNNDEDDVLDDNNPQDNDNGSDNTEDGDDDDNGSQDEDIDNDDSKNDNDGSTDDNKDDNNITPGNSGELLSTIYSLCFSLLFLLHRF